VIDRRAERALFDINTAPDLDLRRWFLLGGGRATGLNCVLLVRPSTQNMLSIATLISRQPT